VICGVVEFIPSICQHLKFPVVKFMNKKKLSGFPLEKTVTDTITIDILTLEFKRMSNVGR
jgi:ribosomal protein L7Ae-like RNA K-turn-binding protein